MTEHTLTRRDAIRGAAAATAAVAGGIPMTQRVAATASGEPELTLNGTIPSGTSIDATVDEYDSSSASTPINSQTTTATNAGTLIFDGLEGSGDYYYEITLGVTGDGSSTPELETPLVFEVPPPGPDDFEFVDYTTKQDWSEKPEKADIAWDEYRLRKYQPKLAMDAKTRERFDGLYGYVATSPERETDVLCYWSKVEPVESLPVGEDELGSSIGDHDPIYVFVNSETGEIERIVYSAYNLEAAEINPTADELTQERASKPTHATFTVVKGWHHYRHTPEATGHFTDLKSWPEDRPTWLDNNFSMDATVVENPWQLASEPDWRDNDSWFSLTDIWLDLGQTLGWYGSKNIDELRE